MTALMENALKESVLKGFFDLAFIEVVPENNGDEIPVIDFTNVFIIQNLQPEQIQLQFYLPIECKRMIVENIYTKLWDDIPSRIIDDCILEMINVVGGNFFSNYFGNEIKYDMSLPSVQFDGNNLPPGADFYFNAEGHTFKITVVKN